jgi:transposase-like protein
MKRTWTIIGVGDVPGSFRSYQALFGQPATLPAHDYFGKILDTDEIKALQLGEEELIKSEIDNTTGNFQMAAKRTRSHPHGGRLVFAVLFVVRDVEELLVERGLETDHVTVRRWVQRYGPELERRLRVHPKHTSKSRCVDETYIRAKRKWSYLYRAVDSTAATIDFLLSAKRDAATAKRFFQKALASSGHPTPRVINVDKCPSYPAAIATGRGGFLQWLGSSPGTTRHINLVTKQAGKPTAGKLHGGFDAAGTGDGFTVQLVRHSQRKRGANG